MKRNKWIFLLALLASSFVQAQSNFQVKVVNWNIEWFGSRTNGPSNKILQEQNVLTVLRWLDADLYALGEIVDTVLMRRVTNALGPNFDFVIADYASLAGSTLDADWAGAQKLAFLYKRNMFSNIRTRGFLRNSGTAYFNFASGRFPFLMNANVRRGNRVANMNFINIHAKSGATPADYARRRDACIEMKDSLDAQFRNVPTLIIGDYNDDFDRTIVQNFFTTLSSYDVLIRDSLPPNGYRAVTLPLSFAGMRSTISFPDVIDHQVYNGAAANWYIPNTAAIAMNVTTVVPTYNTRNTSDHYPVISSFELQNADTSSSIIPPSPTVVHPSNFVAKPTIITNNIHLLGNTVTQQVNIRLIHPSGKAVAQWQKGWQQGVALNLEILEPIPNGVYLLQILGSHHSQTIKIVKQ